MQTQLVCPASPFAFALSVAQSRIQRVVVPNKSFMPAFRGTWVSHTLPGTTAPVQIEIAGFEDNQAYGLGTNTWTEAQKSNAIFGGLAAFFVLFMGGYALN